MFRPGETVCVSNSKYGYHSIPLKNAINGPVTLVPPNDSAEYHYPKTSELTLVALNPIKGFRQDINCTAFRNYLVELDVSTREQQIEYLKKNQLPYSAMIWSGNKSTHTLISLTQDLPSETLYRFFGEWILGIISLADQQTKNPSRSIRIPGVVRPETNQKQELIEFKGPITLEELTNWLKQHPNEKPKQKQEHKIPDVVDFTRIKPWICKMLVDGIKPPNRNKQWFTAAVEFALSGYGDDDTVELLRPYYQSDNDFKEREWETTIRSAFKWAYERKR